jgi:16S rRNA (guanine966-N2)-methyltransferase
VRIIAGSAKSIPLRFPKGANTRPTTDAMREALFSSLADRVEGARFADIYAGSGSVGIEALSRGAEHCVFLDRDARCAAAIAANLRAAHLEDRAAILRGDAGRLWSAACAAYGPFDVVFADPPYGLESFEGLLARLVEGWEGVATGGLVVVQCEVDGPPRCSVQPDRRRKHGSTEVWTFERPPQ